MKRSSLLKGIAVLPLSVAALAATTERAAPAVHHYPRAGDVLHFPDGSTYIVPAEGAIIQQSGAWVHHPDEHVVPGDLHVFGNLHVKGNLHVYGGNVSIDCTTPQHGLCDAFTDWKWRFG